MHNLKVVVLLIGALLTLSACSATKPPATSDRDVGIESLKHRASEGSAQSQYELAGAYLFGQGVPKDAAEAVRWLRKSAAQGYKEAFRGLGYCYYNGEGVEKNPTDAFAWWRKAAQKEVRCE